MSDGTIHNVIIALGTNTAQETSMRKAVRLLGDVIGNMKSTRDMWTEPVGIVSDKFLNRAICGTCTLGRDELHETIRRIEKECGRTEGDVSSGTVRMDIDILRYDGRKEHENDWNREYIKTLIEEL